MSATTAIAPAAGPGVRLRLTGAMLTDVGCVRSVNQDAVAFVLAPENAASTDRLSLALVADGMGGHAAGEVASALAAEVIRRVFFERTGPVAGRLEGAFLAANTAIFDYSQREPDHAGMGTTCTAVAICDDKAWLAHVGDSRAYLLRRRRLKQLSEDHTLVAQLVSEGTLTPEEALVSSSKNVILRALGTRETVQVDVWGDGLALQPGDVLILCSDGLHGLVPDATIADAAERLPPADACQALIQAALQAGGHDNVSVGIFSVETAPAAVKSSSRTTRRIALPENLLAEPAGSSSLTRRIPGPERTP